jgi:plasmid stabilization system protein ParE
MHSLSIHPLATREYMKARKWYRKRSHLAESRFRSAVQLVLDSLETNPLLGTPFRTSYRWKKTKRFPFILYYCIADESTVVVLAIAHQRRRSGYWMRRDK